MAMVTYTDAQKFLEEQEAALQKREEVSQLLCYMADQECQRSSGKAQFYGRCGNLLYGITGGGKLQCYLVEAVDQVVPSELGSMVKEMCKAIEKENILVDYIGASERICSSFLNYYQDGRKHALQTLRTDIMKLSCINSISLQNLPCVPALDSQIDLLAEWLVAFSKEALGITVDQGQARIRVAAMSNVGMLYVLLNKQGIPVSMAAITRKLYSGCAINYVYTPQKERGKGYAKENIYQISKRCLEGKNQYCTLFVDKDNPISNRVYEEVGYEIVEDYSEYAIQNP